MSFVDELARGLLAEADGDPFQLADTLVLLPNRRSCRALREAFLRVGGGRPMLLPSMRPIGDTDEDELLMAEAPLGGGEEIPPAIPSMRRLLLLARLIRDHAPQGERISLDHATHLAGDLARLLDQVQTEGLDFDRLEDLVPERYATHWQKTLELLGIVTTIWPDTLAAEGCIDPADRRNRLLEALTDLWRTEPPTGPGVAPGFPRARPPRPALPPSAAA
ncbi:MAG: double-strand break repair protein AddB, partial [Rhodospirillaceae bacterium]|nr:double-strand break repair protein AddB [Rhodospirillaceae bacterium]